VLSLGLSAAQQRVFHETLASSHSISIRVHILDLNHKSLGEVSERLIGGQVNVDVTGETSSRSASVAFSDPDHSMNFDADSPDVSSVYLNRMLRIFYCVTGPLLADYAAANPGVSAWVNVPVFTGPITAVSRDDSQVQVECQGKEILAQGIAYTPHTYGKGWYRTTIIREIMFQTGETRFGLDSFLSKTATPISLGGGSIPWDWAKSIAAGMGAHIFYDGRGVLRVRRYPTSTQFTFRHGDGGSLVGAPSLSYRLDDVKNIVRVRGGVPAGAKSAVSVDAVAPRTHPLSPWKLGRNGQPRYLLETIEDDTIKSRADALYVASARLDQLMMQSTDVAFDVLPLPHLEPGDLIRLQTPDFSTALRANVFVIPLTAGDTMSVGYMKVMRTGTYKRAPMVLSGTVPKPAKRKPRALRPPSKKPKTSLNPFR